jgi:hypothetical protein
MPASLLSGFRSERRDSAQVQHAAQAALELLTRRSTQRMVPTTTGAAVVAEAEPTTVGCKFGEDRLVMRNTNRFLLGFRSSLMSDSVGILTDQACMHQYASR